MPCPRSGPFPPMAVLVEGGDTNQPIVNTVRGIPDSIGYVIRGMDWAGMIVISEGGFEL